MRNVSLFLVALGFVGCNDYELVDGNDINTGVDLDAVPAIVVTPSAIDFGAIDVGSGQTKTEIVTITNEGDGPLHLSGIELNDPEQPFEVGAVGAVLVPPGGSTEFTVTFSPLTAASNAAAVLVNSDDPDDPTVQVTLNGNGVAPVISLDPTSYDYGTMWIGCEGLQPITISNIGNADLVVTAFSYNTASNDLDFDDAEDTNGELPWTIAPGASVDVWVDYAPIDEFQDLGYLMVESNDPYAPTTMATQQGNGALFGENTDVFEQPINGSTDIIFALDWSCSMYDDIANVQANFDTFIVTLSGMDADYHVAAVTADDGCIVGSQPYVDSSMAEADATALFDDMVGTGSNAGSNTERAFMLLEATLKSSNIGSGGCNEGLYREDATLSLVGVSDEVEQSVNPYTYYVSLFQSMKSDPDDVILHAIGGDYPSGCGGNEPFTGFYEATVMTGGFFLSICATDFGAHMESLAEGSTADLSSFELTDFPVPSTITVKVDGIQATTGWSYNSVDNTVDFEDNYIPEGGSTVEVNYALYGDCEG